MMAEEVPIKLVVVGGPKVGKTSIVHRFKKRKFDKEYLATIGFNVNTFQLTKAIQSQNLDICLQIWDVSHVELKGFHLETIFEDVSGVMLVVDPTDPQSLQAVDDWRGVVYQYCPPESHIPVTLVVSKIDLCQRTTQTATSFLVSSLALPGQASLAKLFGASSEADMKQKKLEKAAASAKGGEAGTGPKTASLADLSSEEMKSVIGQYCELAGIREWKRCSSKTGKNVKDAVYSLVNLSLQPALELRRMQKEKPSHERKRPQMRPVFEQTLDDIPMQYRDKEATRTS